MNTSVILTNETELMLLRRLLKEEVQCYTRTCLNLPACYVEPIEHAQLNMFKMECRSIHLNILELERQIRLCPHDPEDINEEFLVYKPLVEQHKKFYKDLCARTQVDHPLHPSCDESGEECKATSPSDNEAMPEYDEYEPVFTRDTFSSYLEEIMTQKTKHFKIECDLVPTEILLSENTDHICSHIMNDHALMDGVVERWEYVKKYERTNTVSPEDSATVYLDVLERAYLLQEQHLDAICGHLPVEVATNPKSYCSKILSNLYHIQNTIQLEKKKKDVAELQNSSSSEAVSNVSETPSSVKAVNSSEELENKFDSCEATSCDGLLTGPGHDFLIKLTEKLAGTDFRRIYHQVARTLHDTFEGINSPFIHKFLSTPQTGTSLFDTQFKDFSLLPQYFLGVSILYKVVTLAWFYRKYYALLILELLHKIFRVVMFLGLSFYSNALLKGLDSSFYKAILSDDFFKSSKFNLSFFSAIYFINLVNLFKKQKIITHKYTFLLKLSILVLLIIFILSINYT